MNPAADIWAKVLALMQNEMTTTTINTWFDDTTAVELEGDRFVLYSPTPFKRDIIASRYLPAIQNALRELFSAEFQVTVLTEGELDRYQQPKKNDLIPGTESTPLSASWWAPPTNLPMPPPGRWPIIQGTAITPSTSTGSPVWARPTCSTPSPTLSIRTNPACRWST